MAEKFQFNAALLVAGEAPTARQLSLFLCPQQRQQLCWVAADGGCSLASSYQVKLQAIVGDFDSMPVDESSQYIAAQNQLRYCPEKDESDRNLALEYLIERGYYNIVQVGGGGGRSDHFLAMIYDYQFQRSMVLPKLWLTGHEAIVYLEAGEQLEISWPPKESMPTQKISELLLSVFPLGLNCRLHSEQLKWPLDALVPNVFLQQNFPQPEQNFSCLPYSLSNWLLRPPVRIYIEQGAALIFCPYSSLFLMFPSDIPEEIVQGSKSIFEISKKNF